MQIKIVNFDLSLQIPVDKYLFQVKLQDARATSTDIIQMSLWLTLNIYLAIAKVARDYSIFSLMLHLFQAQCKKIATGYL